MSFNFQYKVGILYKLKNKHLGWKTMILPNKLQTLTTLRLESASRKFSNFFKCKKSFSKTNTKEVGEVIAGHFYKFGKPSFSVAVGNKVL